MQPKQPVRTRTENALQLGSSIGWEKHFFQNY